MCTTTDTVFSTCLQSSSTSSEPYTIKIRTKNSSEWSFLCSCKADQGKYKHLMAVLYHLLKNPALPVLTVADLKQKWRKIAAKTVSVIYKTTKLKELCFCKKWLGDSTPLDANVLNESAVEETSTKKENVKYNIITTDEDENWLILQHFVEAVPESWDSKYMEGHVSERWKTLKLRKQREI